MTETATTSHNADDGRYHKNINTNINPTSHITASHLLTACVALQLTMAQASATESEDTGIEGADWMMTLFLSLVLAFFMTFVASLLGYFSYLDDEVLRRYRNEGVLVKADVVSAVVLTTRNMTGSSPSSNTLVFAKKDVSHSVSVEYNFDMASDYKIRIYKKVRVNESDFFYPKLPTMDVQKHVNSVTRSQTEDDANIEGPATTTKRIQNLPQQMIPNHEILVQNFENENRKVHLLVIPGKPKSGIASNCVDRSQTFTHRVAPFAFIAGNLLIVIICLWVATNSMDDEARASDQQVTRIAFGVFLVLSVLQIPCIHFLLHHILEVMLEEDYFETGDLIPQQGLDDSSLSSGSDIFLSDPDKTYNRALSVPEI